MSEHKPQKTYRACTMSMLKKPATVYSTLHIESHLCIHFTSIDCMTMFVDIIEVYKMSWQRL